MWEKQNRAAVSRNILKKCLNLTPKCKWVKYIYIFQVKMFNDVSIILTEQ